MVRQRKLASCPSCDQLHTPRNTILRGVLYVGLCLCLLLAACCCCCCLTANLLLQWRLQVALFVVSVAIYGRAFTADFVWDDRAAVLGNADLRPGAPWSDLLVHDFWGQNITQECVPACGSSCTQTSPRA